MKLKNIDDTHTHKSSNNKNNATMQIVNRLINCKKDLVSSNNQQYDFSYT